MFDDMSRLCNLCKVNVMSRKVRFRSDKPLSGQNGRNQSDPEFSDWVKLIAVPCISAHNLHVLCLQHPCCHHVKMCKILDDHY